MQIEYFPKNFWVFKGQKASSYTFFYKIKNKIGRELGLAPPPGQGKFPTFFFFFFEPFPNPISKNMTKLNFPPVQFSLGVLKNETP